MEQQRASSAAASGSQGPRSANEQLQQTQSQVDEVVGIMKVNVEKVSFFKIHIAIFHLCYCAVALILSSHSMSFL